MPVPAVSELFCFDIPACSYLLYAVRHYIYVKFLFTLYIVYHTHYINIIILYISLYLLTLYIFVINYLNLIKKHMSYNYLIKPNGGNQNMKETKNKDIKGRCTPSQKNYVKQFADSHNTDISTLVL